MGLSNDLHRGIFRLANYERGNRGKAQKDLQQSVQASEPRLYIHGQATNTQTEDEIAEDVSLSTLKMILRPRGRLENCRNVNMKRINSRF
jgi:hypothetical protein